MAEQKRPDYRDADWGPLIKDRTAKWAKMWEELENEGIRRTPLWEKEEDVPYWLEDGNQPIPSLAILPIQKERRGIIIVCAGGAVKKQP